MSDEAKVYLARAGKFGEDEEVALERDLAIVGFTDIPSLNDAKDYDAVFAVVKAHMEGAKVRAIGNRAGQLWAFAVAMQEGDIVVMPRELTSQIAIGRVTGPYHYQIVRTELRHTRPVRWERPDVPALRSSRTCCNLSAHS